MKNLAEFKKVDVLVVGAGVAGLAAAVTAKTLSPDLSVCVIDKAPGPGTHNISGATFDISGVFEFLELVFPGWKENPKITSFLGRRVEKEDFYMLTSEKRAIKITPALKLAKKMKLPAGEMISMGDVIISISKLVRVVEALAVERGVEVFYNFPAEKIDFDKLTGMARGVKLADKGRYKDGSEQFNFRQGDLLEAKFVILAEGADGYVSEQFVTCSELERDQPQLYSIGVKEVLEVSPSQYASLGDRNVVRFAGYPLWKPFANPSIFGGGALYPMGSNKVAVVLISALDWKYKDFSPFEAFELFKEHPAVAKYIAGAKVLESGAKMIPEGGYYAMPRDKVRGTIASTTNVALVGDCAGFVNMQRMKGISNAVLSGVQAGKAIGMSLEEPNKFAKHYTCLLDSSDLIDQMKVASKYRQIIAKFGVTLGLLLSNLDFMMPLFKVQSDRHKNLSQLYAHAGKAQADQSFFIKNSGVLHREDQKPHLIIKDVDVCKWQCSRTYDCPCLTFCPGQVYERMHEHIMPVNPSNCLHCKTCQRKCPYNNIEWTVPEAGGPRYTDM